MLENVRTYEVRALKIRGGGDERGGLMLNFLESITCTNRSTFDTRSNIIINRLLTIRQRRSVGVKMRKRLDRFYRMFCEGICMINKRFCVARGM